ncbi:hypothetical protein AXG93_4510s1200 [Marchantia polymorpha subsp. ruderalis]|uniref:Reverse transcriptase Ty1/copia-type domain-containing protein n=1 Tax=Marchantia polymorpha subsp. ruderalis TaxID=1480154 RepID=A0A176WEK0_MARPO|nr:hypothetical protein AXG93_4510s1200 [Marchantia polymorpha subsp. ruderalis]
MFNMENTNAFLASMMRKSKTDDYRTSKLGEEKLDKPKYLGGVDALLYLATNTRPDMSIAVSILAQHRQCPTAQHCQGVNHLLSSRVWLYIMQTAISKMTRFPF